MKRYFPGAVFSMIILYLCFGISSCKHKHETPAEQKGKIYFHMHTNIDTSEVDSPDSFYMDAEGRQMSLSLANMYISGIKVKKPDGSFVEITDAVVLKTIDEEQYLVGTVPVGDYTSVSFNVGVDANTNQKDPATFSSSNPLSPQIPEMWFGSTSLGYIFMNLAGTVDTSADHSGSTHIPFTIKIGSDNLLRNVIMPNKAFTVSPDEMEEIHLIWDVGALLQGIDFRGRQATDTYTNNPALASEVADRIPNMFRYE